MRRGPSVALPLLLALAPACRSPYARQAVPDRPQWVAVGVGAFDRDDDGTTGVDGETAGVLLEGGYDFASGPLRPTFEMLWTWGGYDVDDGVLDDDGDRLDVWRLGAGGRLAWVGEESAWVPYVRAGVFYVDDFDEGFDSSGTGWYAGGGIDVWYDAIGSLGPFVLFLDGGEDDLEELAVGLVARFHYGRF